MSKKARKYHYLLCAYASQPATFDDDVFGDCCDCGVRLRVRPHAPKEAKRICEECAKPYLIKDNTKVGVTDKTVKEIIELLRRSRGLHS